MSLTAPRQHTSRTSVVVLIAASWAGLIAWQLTADADTHGPAGGAMVGMSMAPATGTASVGALHAGLISLPMWMVMCVAMMGPVTVPIVRQHWARGEARALAVGATAIAHLAMWTLFGAVALLAVRWASADTRLALGLALLLAAAWQLTVPKRWALAAAHGGPPPPPHRAARDALARRIARGAAACLTSCWALMLVMAVVPMRQMLIWMPLLTAIAAAEPLGRRPRVAVRVAAVALAAAAAVVLALAV